MFIGRTTEKKEVLNYIEKKENSPTATLIGVNGMRRVGKSTFIENIIQNISNKKDVLLFQFIGLQNAENKKNIELCKFKLEHYIYEIENFVILDKKTKKTLLEQCQKIKSWQEFFNLLSNVLKTINKLNSNIKPVLFFDEICWFSKKDNFVFAFKYFWNLELVKISKMVCFMAGSKISWMKDKLFEDKKEFLNRIDLIIELKPFSILEIAKYLKFSLYQKDLTEEDILKYYSIFGGIIKYYQLIDFNKSFKENIESFLTDDRKQQFILTEKEMLFDSIFSGNRLHKEIIQCLCHSKSLNILKLEEKLKLLVSNKNKINRTSLYRDLEELIQNNIIVSNNKSKDKTFYINSNFSYFYFYWFENNIFQDKKQSSKALNTKIQAKKEQFSYENSTYDQWKGVAFEIMVFNQIEHILRTHKWIENKKINDKHLNFISKKNSEAESQDFKNTHFQLDLLIDYDFDKHLIIETKCYNNEWIISSNEFENFHNKKTSLAERYVKLLIISLNNSKFNKHISFDNDNMHNFDVLILKEWLKEQLELL